MGARVRGVRTVEQATCRHWAVNRRRECELPNRQRKPTMHLPAVDWSPLPPPDPALRCVIVMPVRNEAALLPQALAALTAQVEGRDDCEVLVLANNCADDSARQARAFARGCLRCPIHVVEAELPQALANVGVARRELMDEAGRRLAATQRPDGAILSTDGDTRVEPDWLAENLAGLAAGADAVGGRILTDSDLSWPSGIVRLQRLDCAQLLLRSRLESLVDPQPGDPWPRHHQHFGASLAVSAAAYRKVGGEPRVPYLEDEALVVALRREDCVVRHSPAVRVRTSGRLDGRAEVGLSWQLRQWADQSASRLLPLVDDPDRELLNWSLRRQARLAWRSRRRDRPLPLDGLTGALGICPRWAAAAFALDQPFGRLWEEIDRRRLERQGGPALVPLDHAVQRLRQLVRSYRPALAEAALTRTCEP